MDLIHMAREPKGEGLSAPVNPTTPYYPYGLTLRLDQEALEDLDIELDELPTAGTEFHLEAHGVITEASTSDPDADGDIDHVSLTLQITHLGFMHDEEGPTRDSDHDRATRMYGAKEG